MPIDAQNLFNGLVPQQKDYGQQLADQAYSAGNERANLSLYDPKVLEQLKSIFGPLFGAQQGQLSQARAGAVNEAGRSAGAQAAFSGSDPSAFVQASKNRAASPYSQAFQNLSTSQLQTLLGATSATQEFKAGNLGANAANLLALLGIHTQYDLQNKAQGTFLENLLGGLIKGGAQLGSAAILAPSAAVTGKP